MQTELENADKIKKQMDDLDSKHPPGPKPYLLTYYYQNEGKFAVALGNPDTADNTAVVVPGTTHDVKNEGAPFEPVGQGEDLLAKMNERAPGAKNSTIVWMGTDMPDELPSAANTTYGDIDHGGGRLRDDVAGYNAAHAQANDGYEGHTTVIAHSYGSYMSGEAIKGGMNVDDFVNIGSAGIKADNAGELGMANEHVWAAEAPGDPIDLAPPWLGESPMSDSFGATEFGTGSAQGHSEYYSDDVSLTNMADIAVGRYDDVTTPQPLPDPDPDHRRPPIGAG